MHLFILRLLLLQRLLYDHLHTDCTKLTQLQTTVVLWVTPPVVVLRIKGNNDNSYFLRICPLDTNTALVPIQVRHTNPLNYFHGAIQTDSLTTTLCPSLWSKAPCKLPLRHALSDLPYPTTPTSPASQPTNLPWRCAWEINNNRTELVN